MANHSLYLGSNSPRRRELLAQIGVHCKQFSVDIDETPGSGESPRDYVLRMAREKALASRAALAGGQRLPVLCADTTVVAGGAILGKPANREQGILMLQTLANNEHQVLTAVAIADQQCIETRLSSTRVWFGSISDEQASRYWDSGEPADKAGGYGIQGLGAIFVQRIEGSYSGVVGLPLAETAELLAQFKVPYWV
ncbi:Maf-like protein [Aestuariirhabdus sp. Z084]|uniref:Maf family protein n=1 Tax=Aestuariirhabdus haliotis TaxID=2918751 RepID=UPI0020C0A8CF|nr:Maf family protein [Aestuariirhabdus haliotis]MCL6415215.1 Maf-like protein [Aestuariirhabdus haliotis]